MRRQCNHEEMEAHRILDCVRAGVEVPESTVTWALLVLGDALGLGAFNG